MYECVGAGNKADMESERQVSAEEAQSLVRECRLLQAVETSAKENLNIDDAFLGLAAVRLFWLLF